MFLDDYVCLACERGLHRLCPGHGCTCVEPSCRIKPEPKPAPSPKRERTEPTCRRGPKHGARIDTAKAHAIALDLVTVCECHGLPLSNKREIAERHDVTYEQVRTVLRNLETLNGDARHSKAKAHA